MARLTTEQVRAARALLRWSQADLARHSGVSLPTVRRLEATPGIIAGRAETVWKLQEALEQAGVRFVYDDSTVGVTLAQVE